METVLVVMMLFLALSFLYEFENTTCYFIIRYLYI